MAENQSQPENARSAFLVPRTQVKRVKTALEERGLLDRATKIIAETEPKMEEGKPKVIKEPRMIINSSILIAHDVQDHLDERAERNTWKDTLLAGLQLEDLKDVIEISSYIPKPATATPTSNPLLKALKIALEALPADLLASLSLSVSTLLSSFPDSYSFYKPLLLLPHNIFTSPPWSTLLSLHPPHSPILQELWRALASSVGATHIAINAGIPPKAGNVEGIGQENILRSPSNLTSIYGDFGPAPNTRTLSNPTEVDFSSALWVKHTQNGIHQTWAPLYTMFSRGNIREKTRLLTLPSVLSSISEGKGKSTQTFTSEIDVNAQSVTFKPGCAVVDLYAGIGYFAFSYKKAGIGKVLCWELNPWSVEGLRRGAALNNWTTQTFTELPKTNEEWITFADATQDIDFLIFQQSNEHALSPIMVLKADLGSFLHLSTQPLSPIRHINCGLLPSSQLSWRTAIICIDRGLGGWIHAHENVGIAGIEARAKEVEEEMQGHLDSWEASRGACGSYRRPVKCEHVERVKTYAPGVLHVVFDVWVAGMKDTEDTLD